MPPTLSLCHATVSGPAVGVGTSQVPVIPIVYQQNLVDNDFNALPINTINDNIDSVCPDPDYDGLIIHDREDDMGDPRSEAFRERLSSHIYTIRAIQNRRPRATVVPWDHHIRTYFPASRTQTWRENLSAYDSLYRTSRAVGVQLYPFYYVPNVPSASRALDRLAILESVKAGSRIACRNRAKMVLLITHRYSDSGEIDTSRHLEQDILRENLAWMTLSPDLSTSLCLPHSIVWWEEDVFYNGSPGSGENVVEFIQPDAPFTTLHNRVISDLVYTKTNYDALHAAD